MSRVRIPCPAQRKPKRWQPVRDLTLSRLSAFRARAHHSARPRPCPPIRAVVRGRAGRRTALHRLLLPIFSARGDPARRYPPLRGSTHRDACLLLESIGDLRLDFVGVGHLCATQREASLRSVEPGEQLEKHWSVTPSGPEDLPLDGLEHLEEVRPPLRIGRREVELLSSDAKALGHRPHAGSVRRRRRSDGTRDVSPVQRDRAVRPDDRLLRRHVPILRHDGG